MAPGCRLWLAPGGILGGGLRPSAGNAAALFDDGLCIIHLFLGTRQSGPRRPEKCAGRAQNKTAQSANAGGFVPGDFLNRKPYPWKNSGVKRSLYGMEDRAA